MPGGNGSTNAPRERHSSKDNGRDRGKSAAQPVATSTHEENSSELEQARATILPFGTRNHPEYKGKTLGEVSTLNGELVAWLATEFSPTSNGGRTVQRAAKIVTEQAKAA